ncbi:hypothetical protein M9458_000294, partial [Cirrhinus mrigala]
SLDGKYLELLHHGDSYNFSVRKPFHTHTHAAFQIHKPLTDIKPLTVCFLSRSHSQGLYNLDFHNCPNTASKVLSPYSLHVSTAVRIQPSQLRVEITEKNPNGYLSAAEIPLPRLYISMAAIFFTAAVVWTYTLLKY